MVPGSLSLILADLMPLAGGVRGSPPLFMLPGIAATL